MRLGLFLLAAGILLQSLPADAATRFSEIEGKVRWRVGEDDDLVAAKAGQSLNGGAQVLVGPASRAVLGFEDGSNVELGEGSDFTLEAPRGKASAMKLALGLLTAWVQKPSAGFSVRTPTAVVAVRGTHFTVAVMKGGKTRVRVFSGVVSVKDHKGRETTLKEGQSVEATTAGAGAVTTAVTSSIPGTGWAIEAPPGWTRMSSDVLTWDLESQEVIPGTGGARTASGIERITLSVEDASQWPGPPADCGAWGNGAPFGVWRGTQEGKPAFSFACAGKDGRAYGGPSTGWSRRFIFNYDDAHVICVIYDHVRGATHDLWHQPGTAVKDYMDSIGSIRPEAGAVAPTPAPKNSDDGKKAVPLLR